MVIWIFIAFLWSTCHGAPSSEVCSGGVSAEIKADVNDIHFYLYTRANRAERDELFVTEESISGSHFDQSRDETIFIIHGFNDNSGGWMGKDTGDLLLTEGDHNIILVDWREHATGNYFDCVKNVHIVGDQIALLMNSIVEYTGLDPARVTMIAHSLGVHVAGDAGMVCRKWHGITVGRIIGLDPAGPAFDSDDIDVRLDPSDAEFVVAVHSNGGSLLDGCIGIGRACGHMDFYANGGVHQPGCTDWGDLWDLISGGCSHLKSGRYMMESILKPSGFMSTECESYEDYQQGKCEGNAQTTMGYHTKHNSGNGGKFYLTTNEESPFSID